MYKHSDFEVALIRSKCEAHYQQHHFTESENFRLFIDDYLSIAYQVPLPIVFSIVNWLRIVWRVDSTPQKMIEVTIYPTNSQQKGDILYTNCNDYLGSAKIIEYSKEELFA